MNRSRLVYICTIVLSLFCLAPLQAAKPSATQYVQVFEYLPDLKHVGAEAKRIPLSNVEVTVLGAGTVSTDHNGVCKLDFLTKQPGDELHFRRVYKAGYEILNPVQTNVIYVIHSASDTIPLVMITHENQARRAELFSKFAETQYANQMAAEKARLDKSDAEYEASLKQIELDYQQKLDNIENYIRTLSRMDFTALSGKEKEAFDMYLSGNYDKAIETVENMHLVDLYRQSAQKSHNIEEARQKVRDAGMAHRAQSDTLKRHLYTHLSLLTLEGSPASQEKAMRILEKMLDVDPLSMQSWNKYIGLCLDSKYFVYGDSAIRSQLLRPELTPFQNAFFRASLSQMLIGQKQYAEARHYMATSELKRDSMIQLDPNNSLLWYQKMCCHQMNATCMYNYGEYDKAIRQIQKSYDAYLHLRPLDQEQLLYVEQSYVTLGRNIDLLLDMGQQQFADSIFRVAESRVKLRFGKQTLKIRYVRISYNIHNADMLMQHGRYEEAFEIFEQQVPELEYIYSVNPMLVDELYLRTLTALRDYYKFKSAHQKMFELCRKSEAVYQRMTAMEAEVNARNSRNKITRVDSTFVKSYQPWYADLRFDYARAWRFVDPNAQTKPIFQEIIDNMEQWPSRTPEQQELLEECRKELKRN
ncbi:MAG: hypothetical protein IJP70_07505 [Bacteroidales bacterium]|nr:hypothetical protein [Bacteroidales bacterium]